MKRILFACTEMHSHGGIQRFNTNLVQAWIDLGMEVDIVSVNDRQEMSEKYRHVKNVRCYYANRKKTRWIIKFFLLVLRNKYDCYTCGHINLMPAFVAILVISLRHISKSVLILHGIEVWGRVKGIKRLTSERAGSILGVSKYTVTSFLGQVPGYPETNTAIFPNTISPEWVKRAPSRIIKEKSTHLLRLLSVTRLSISEREKGITHVLEALAKLDNGVKYEYTIVGEGDDLNFLQSLAESLGIGSHVHFSGALSDDQLWSEYDKAHMFVLPSRKEGFGIVFLEAMYFGLPVLAAAEKGALDVVEDGVNGFLVPYGDSERIMLKIRDAASASGLLEKLGRNGHAMVLPGGRFSYEAFRERTRSHFPFY